MKIELCVALLVLAKLTGVEPGCEEITVTPQVVVPGCGIVNAHRSPPQTYCESSGTDCGTAIGFGVGIRHSSGAYYFRPIKVLRHCKIVRPVTLSGTLSAEDIRLNCAHYDGHAVRFKYVSAGGCTCALVY